MQAQTKSHYTNINHFHSPLSQLNASSLQYGASRPPRRASAPRMQELVDVHGVPRLHAQPIDDIPNDADEVDVEADSCSE